MTLLGEYTMLSRFEMLERAIRLGMIDQSLLVRHNDLYSRMRLLLRYSFMLLERWRNPMYLRTVLNRAILCC